VRAWRFLSIGAGFVAIVLLVVTVAGQPGTPVRLLITGGIVVTMDASRRVIPNGAVAVDADRIVAVGTTDEITGLFTAAERIDAQGQVVLPGLVNTHTHVPMTLYRGLADDLTLMDWLEHYMFPAEARTVSPEFVRIGTRLAALEMIESGTTTFADMYYFEDDIAEVTRAAGLRGILGQTVIGFPVTDARTPADALARADAFIAKWKGDALVTPAVAPHAAYSLDPVALQAARELANRHNVPLLIHLSETRDESKRVIDPRGSSSTRHLEALGIWNGRSIAAHAIWLDAADMAILGKRAVGLSHNPESNMKLASGVAAVTAWLAQGLRAGLGTDGPASNNDLDMFEAMRTAALLQKVTTGDPRALPAGQALELATRRGAEVLGLADRIGSLEPGKQADIITVSMEGARQTPMFDVVSHLVYVSRGDDVRTTIVAGRILMNDRRVTTLTAEPVLRDARAMAERVRSVVDAAAQDRALRKGKRP
jgi:5-methylthioadenosine/S-adenosylhomocysteine deaminase